MHWPPDEGFKQQYSIRYVLRCEMMKRRDGTLIVTFPPIEPPTDELQCQVLEP